jgi:hypothetical protein
MHIKIYGGTLGNNMEENVISYGKNKLAMFGHRYSHVSIYESQDDKNISLPTTFGSTDKDAFLKYNNITSPNH